MPIKGGFQSNNSKKTEKKEVNTKPVVSEETENPCDNVPHDINKFGVTYYKINDKSKMYGEDNTQDGCLNPNQMDANFNFLHGDDIKQGRFDPKKQVLVLDRFFCDKDMAKYAKKHPSIGPIIIPTDELFSGTTFSGDTLYIHFNGSVIEVTGFEGGGGTVKPEDVIRIVREYLRGDEGIDIRSNDEEAVIYPIYFDGGEIDIIE